MLKRKTNNGITLIALVITIIVLLILAGVAISTLTGDNGILTKAAQAKKDTERESAKERIQIEVMGSYGEDGTLDIDTLKSNLNKKYPRSSGRRRYISNNSNIGWTDFYNRCKWKS